MADGDPTMLDELKDAVSTRTALLVVGVLILQLLFIWSYAAAFHKPNVARVPVAVVIPETVAPKVLNGLNTLPGDPVAAHQVDSLARAIEQLTNREVQAVFIPSPNGTTDHLIVQSATGPAGAEAMRIVFDKVDATLHRTLIVTDRVQPLYADVKSLTSFYLVIGWCVGGYLLASLLSMSFGARPANLRRALIRLACIALYAIASGLLGSLIVGSTLHALPHAWSLWWIGALVVFATGAFAMALQVAFGTQRKRWRPLPVGAPPTALAHRRSVAPERSRGRRGALHRLSRWRRHHQRPPRLDRLRRGRRWDHPGGGRCRPALGDQAPR
jgi:hypothetical protein